MHGYHIDTDTLVPASFNLGSHRVKGEKLSYHKKETPPHLSILFSDARQQKMALVIKDSLEKALPITLHLIPKESKMLVQDRLAQDYDLMIGSWIADLKDPENFLEIFGDKNHFL